MTTDQLQELQRLNTQLQMQVWVIGGLCIVMLGMIAYLSKSAFEEIKQILKEYGKTIGEHSSDLAVIKSSVELGEHFSNASDKIAEAIDNNGDKIISKIRAITPNER